MRFNLIVGREHGQDSLSVIVEPGVPREVRDLYMDAIQNPGKLAEIQLWDSGSGIVKRKKFDAPAREIHVPSLEEVLKVGYGEDVAPKIIARAQAQADALRDNPAISDEDLHMIGALAEDAKGTPEKPAAKPEQPKGRAPKAQPAAPGETPAPAATPAAAVDADAKLLETPAAEGAGPKLDAPAGADAEKTDK